MFEFEYELTGTGWSQARVADEHCHVTLTASYLSDALRSLIEAAALAVEGYEAGPAGCVHYSVDIRDVTADHRRPMARMLTAERRLRGQAPSSFGAYPCQPGRALDHERKPGRRGSADAGSPVVRW